MDLALLPTLGVSDVNALIIKRGSWLRLYRYA